MVGLIVALDASGDKNTAVLAVAGLLSNETNWRDFREQWLERIKKDGIEFFRAVDAATFHGPFEH